MKWLFVALLGILAAVFWPQQETVDDVVEAVDHTPRVPSKPNSTVAKQPEGERAAAGKVRLAEMQVSLFPAQTWVPPPPPPPKPPPPPPPKPPALPFTYVGRWLEGGEEVVFLTQGSRTFTAKKGEILSGGWRLEEIMRNGVVFTYLPLDMQSTLGIKR